LRRVRVVPVLLAAASLLRGAAVGQESGKAPGFSFTNVAAQAGLDAVTVFGGKDTNRYLLETTGCGAAFFDYDGDGWQDVFLVNGTTLAGFPKGQEPTNHLYRNRGDGTFEDTTRKAGLAQGRVGPGRLRGDYDNDGREDLFVSYFGQNRLYHNRGDGAFDDVTQKAGLTAARPRWGTGCAFLDYDRDGRLDLMVANYIDLDLATAPTPDSGLCRYKGIKVACGPPGLPGGKNVLYHNRGDGTFEDASDKSGITKASGTYGLGVSTLDFDGDGWTDIYVANDSNPSALYRNNHDGSFTDIAVTAGCAYSQDGKPQAGMGIGIGDYDRNGTMDIFKTNFAGDTSTLYSNSGDGFCEDKTFASGIGINTRWLGWGTALRRPRQRRLAGPLPLQRPRLSRGGAAQDGGRLPAAQGRLPQPRQRPLRGRHRALGPPASTPKAARGAAFGDFDNDGDVDVVINNVHDAPDLFRVESDPRRHWITVRLVGTRSNRSAIGARLRCTAGGAVRRRRSAAAAATSRRTTCACTSAWAPR
jgi:hypothetical protein